MVNWNAMQAYKGQATEANVRCLSAGSWKASLKKGGALTVRGGGGARAKGLGKQKTLFPPAEGWVGGNPDMVKSFTSRQATHLHFDKQGYSL